MTGQLKVIGLVGSLAAGAAIVVAGCGTSDYNEHFYKRLDTLRAGARFRVLWAPTSLSDTPVKIRVPRIFNKSYTANSPHPEDGPKVRADRINPPFLELPGLRICYEGRGRDAEGRRLPYYCYLAVTPSKPGDVEKLAADVREKLKKAFKEVPAWEPIDAKTPDEKALQWQKIRVTGDQQFPINFGGRRDGVPVVTGTYPGIFELWVYDAQQYIVLVGWRTPATVEGAVAAPKVKTAADLYLGPSADKIDLSTLPFLTAGTLVIETTPEAIATAQR